MPPRTIRTPRSFLSSELRALLLGPEAAGRKVSVEEDAARVGGDAQGLKGVDRIGPVER